MNDAVDCQNCYDCDHHFRDFFGYAYLLFFMSNLDESVALLLIDFLHTILVVFL